MKYKIRTAVPTDEGKIRELFLEMLRTIYHTDDVKGYGDGDLYRKAEQYCLVKKMHAGEAGTADDVRRAVEALGLSEVHHGIAASTSKETMRFLADNHIQLNVCPSSNVMLGYVKDYSTHPIRTLVENEVRVTINTDDLLIFDSTIDNEYLKLYRAGTLSVDQLDEIRRAGLGTGWRS